MLSLKIVEDYARSCEAAEKDIDYIKNDEYIKRLLGILTEFGIGSRYYNLNLLFREESLWSDPEEKLERIGATREDSVKDVDEIIAQINKEMIIGFEKLTRALARILTLGNLGDFAKVMGNEFYDFLVIKDNELGEKDY